MEAYFDYDFGFKFEGNELDYNGKKFTVKSELNKPLGVIKELWLILVELKLIDSVNWVYVFTDGSASNNGKADAIARGGFYLEISINSLGKEIINPFNNYHNVKFVKSFNYLDNSIIVSPSNNRGELLGICSALQHLKLLGKIIQLTNVLIITDSMYAINTINDYYPARLKKGTESELLNCDLLQIAHGLNQFKFEHIRSHKKQPCECSCDKLRKWKGNDIIDKLVSI